MNCLTKTKRTRGYSGLNEIQVLELDDYRGYISILSDMKECNDFATVDVDEVNNQVVIKGYELFTDIIDAKRYSEVRGHVDFVPFMWEEDDEF